MHRMSRRCVVVAFAVLALAGAVLVALFALVIRPPVQPEQRAARPAAAPTGEKPVEDPAARWPSTPELQELGPLDAFLPSREIAGEGAPFSLVLVRCVTGSPPEPVPGARLLVAARAPGGQGGTHFADADGIARVKARSGGAYVAKTAYTGLTKDPKAYFWGITTFDVPRQLGRVYRIDHELVRGVDVSGRVVEAGSGRPLAGYHVVCNSTFDGSPKAYDTMSGDDGTFVFPALCPGKWSFFATGKVGRHRIRVLENVDVAAPAPRVVIEMAPWE